jgi:hypothetical protein
MIRPRHVPNTEDKQKLDGVKSLFDSTPSVLSLSLAKG